MRHGFRKALGLASGLCLMMAAVAAAQQKHAITPVDLVDLRTVSDIQVSADGRRVAFVVTEPGDPTKPQAPRDTNIWVAPADGSEPARRFAASPRSESHPRWSPEGRYLAFLSNRGEPVGNAREGKTQVYLLPTSGGEAQQLTSVMGNVQDLRWSRDGSMMAFTVFDPESETEQRRHSEGFDEHWVDHNYKFVRLWVVTVADHIAELVTNQDLNVSGFDWSPDGTELVARVSATPKADDVGSHARLVVIRRRDGEVLRTLSDHPGGQALWSPDGQSIAFEERAPSGIGSWMVLMPAAGGEARPLLKDYAGTPRAYQWATGPSFSDAQHLVMEVNWHTYDKFLRVNAADGSFVELPVEAAVSAADFSISSDGGTLAYARGTADSAVDVWAYAGAKKKLTELNPQVKNWLQGDVKEISWKSKKDGLTLYGVLVTPPDFKPGQRYPTLVFYHGGPAGAWWSGFMNTPNVWAQIAAARGYVVFLPNPRGSTGQGWKFVEANRDDWGGGDFRDVMDGVDYLIDQKIADPARLGVGGSSYGGYMTAWTVTQTNRFKVAVLGFGMTDLFSFNGTTDITPSFLRTYFLDTPFNGRAAYDNHSAMTFLKNCRTPTLVLHGEQDERVPIGQGWEFYNGLRVLGVPVEFVTYPREHHGFHERAHQIDSLTRTMEWFDKYLKP